jgi:transcription elongation factor Elf1
MFTLGLIACFQEDGATAKDALTILKKRVAKPPFDNQETYLCTLSYLSAILDQSGGLLNSTLATYSSALFALPEKSSQATYKTDMGILAGLNRVLIVRNPTHPEHGTTGALLAQLQPFCEYHPNQYMKMAFRVVYAISSPNSSINRQKTLTNNATQKSHDLFQRTRNREFLVMALCYFTSRFFVDQVTEKSMSAVQAVRQHAKSSNKPLWLAVACGLMITVYRHNNMVSEVERYQQVFDRVRERLPPVLRGDEDIDAEGEDDEEL